MFNDEIGSKVKIKNAIVIGASSGIGRELAKMFSKSGISVGVAARRLSLLNELQATLDGVAVVKAMDISRPEAALAILSDMIDELGGVDLILVAAGVGDLNKELNWEAENQCIATNVTGFTAVAAFAIKYFIERGSGHFVGISSLAALRGGADAPAYNASKAYMVNYLEGLRKKVTQMKLPIVITDVRPGFVDTRMAKGDGLFWVAPPEKAARQIYQAVLAKKTCVYVTRRWRLMAWLLKFLPSVIYYRI